MATTKQLPREQWKEYFDTFTKNFLRDPNPEAAVIELVSPELGDQVEADHVRVIGVTYDHKDNVLEVALEDLDHLIYNPKEIWVLEEDNGFVSSIEVVRDDDTREIIRLQSVGIVPAKQ
ncbi:DUF5335 domain-containing protein [Rhodocaloribacter litoris]|uniref:DUF5335 family protein n=1 Tax=Rhodocaloribacter litoris TaxID=2558931 RepID=UPI001421ACC8|nr:DUF5335 family protein [Rhodocaloribacter litoris]QXD13768.1 DUF5335 domain-containing protein [Rhodocaloribacter litoris]